MAEKKTVFEMAQEYYPRLWSAKRIEALYKAGKLTKEEYDSIIKDNNSEVAK